MSQGVVKVSELKNRLSHYLRQVKQGESLLVCDRDHVIARIEPAGGAILTSDNDARWLTELERRGTIRRATTPLPRGWVARRPKIRANLVDALLADRADGR